MRMLDFGVHSAFNRRGPVRQLRCDQGTNFIEYMVQKWIRVDTISVECPVLEPRGWSLGAHD